MKINLNKSTHFITEVMQENWKFQHTQKVWGFQRKWCLLSLEPPLTKTHECPSLNWWQSDKWHYHNICFTNLVPQLNHIKYSPTISYSQNFNWGTKSGNTNLYKPQKTLEPCLRIWSLGQLSALPCAFISFLQVLWLTSSLKTCGLGQLDTLNCP